MKFITSTNLKLWADTNDCEQTLPELVRKLIVASTTKCDRLSFPSGDATFLPGFDGVVSCKDDIDLIPSGISVWECGSDKNIKGKIDGDFSKRVNNPLGVEKNNSTFIFVTPRIWRGAETWLKSHEGEWGKIVIYTAVELESWIDKTPAVGMWLAEKLNILPSRGYKLPITFWNEWGQGKDYLLPYKIVLSGREEISEKIIDTCEKTGSIILESLTQNEGIAFAIASIMTSSKSEMLKDKMIIVNEKNAFDDLVHHYSNLILITSLTDDIHYATKRGHAIIVVSTPDEQLKGAITLPIIDKEGFVAALTEVGIDDGKARKIALDTARDINVFRRRCGIMVDKPKWIKSTTDLMPALLAGKWMDNIEGDRAVLETLSGMEYNQFESKLYDHLFEEETPLIHIGNMWRIRSPYEAIAYLQKKITPKILNQFREICQNLIQDDDPNALEKISSDSIYLKQYKQKYSSTIKEGFFQNLCLMSIVDHSDCEQLHCWVDDTMKLLLKDWDLLRFLSNSHYLTILAETSPNAFLDFVEHLPIEIVDMIFTPIKTNYSLSGWEILYTDILFAMEMLAWEPEYLNRVTALLFRFSEYKNDSNYGNKPENSIYNIYRLYLPQTHVSFENRLQIIRSYAPKYKNIIYKICEKNCESLVRCFCEPNQYYRWRLFGEFASPKYFNRVSIKQLNAIVTLMLDCCDYSNEAILGIITISAKKSMGNLRMQILDKVRDNMTNLSDTKNIADGLRKIIHHHLAYLDSDWSLNELELKPYNDLLEEIEPKDLLSKSTWLFEYHYIKLPYTEEKDFDKSQRELFTVRTKALQEIIDFYGQDGIWEFEKLVKCPESMANGLVSIYNEKIIYSVIEKYRTKEIRESFAKAYFCELCHKDLPSYAALAKKIIESDSELVIVLYAPNYVAELAKIASDCGYEIKRRYWESVSTGFILGNADNIIRELIGVKRYSDAIELLCNVRNTIQMSDLEIVNLIYSFITENEQTKNQMDLFYVETLLKDLDKSEDSEVIRLLVQIEFLLFRVLENGYKTSQMRLIKEFSHNPELLFQLVELTYKPDDESDEHLADIASKNDTALREHASYILLFGKNIVSFVDNNGEINGAFMNQYIDQLYKLAKQKKREKAIDYVVGDILGDIPRDGDYPPTALCELVERLNSDIVDQHIRIRIFNSRGLTSRTYNEGGDQERNIALKLKDYREKTKLSYPRMTKIFDDLITEYQRQAKYEDDEASIMDLDY